MTNAAQSYTCQCLNVRFSRDGEEAFRVSVAHPRLIDLVLQHQLESQIYLVCLLCGQGVFSCLLRQIHFYSSQTAVEFQYPAFEAVTIPGGLHSNLAFGLLDSAQYLAAINSPAFSPTFGVTLSFSFLDEQGDDPQLQSPIPTQLDYLFSDLCDIVVKRAIRLRAEADRTRCHVQSSLDFSGAGEEQRMRSDFQALGRVLWDRAYLGHSPDTCEPQFDDAVQPHLARIDTTFQALRRTNETLHSTSPVHSDLIAITIEGLSSHRTTGLPDPLCRNGSTGGPSFHDLPIETAWKILDFLKPVYTSKGGQYIPNSRATANDYCTERFSFAQLMLVSKLWSQIIPPLLYHTIVLFAIPDSLHSLVTALGSRGNLVRTIIIDDVQLDPRRSDVHIRTCRRYIDKCFELSTDALRVECHGDYQVEFRDSRIPTPKSQIRTLVLGLPASRLPSDLPSAFSSVPGLEHLYIDRWQFHPLSRVLDSTTPRLSECRTIYLHRSDMHRESIGTLLSLASIDGKTTLDSLSILDVPTLQPSDILTLLQINSISLCLTTLRIQLGYHDSQHTDTENNLPIQLLALCPSLTEFSYTSPSSVEIFNHLPSPLRVLKLAVLLPFGQGMPSNSNPSISSVDPFITYLNSDRASALKRLSITRHLPRDYRSTVLDGLRVRRLDSQSWDERGMLRATCNALNVHFDCTFSPSIGMDVL